MRPSDKNAQPRNRHQHRVAKSARAKRVIPPIRDGQIVCGAKQAAKAIGVSDSTMWDYIGRGLVESRKVGGRRFVVVASLRRLVGAEGE
jgi:hypothetical protein